MLEERIALLEARCDRIDKLSKRGLLEEDAPPPEPTKPEMEMSLNFQFWKDFDNSNEPRTHMVDVLIGKAVLNGRAKRHAVSLKTTNHTLLR